MYFSSIKFASSVRTSHNFPLPQHFWTHTTLHTPLPSSSLKWSPSFCFQSSRSSFIHLFITLCCNYLSMLLWNHGLSLTPSAQETSTSFSFNNFYLASVIFPAQFPRVMLRVVRSRVDHIDLLTHVWNEHLLEMNNRVILENCRTERNTRNNLILSSSYL